MQLLKKHIISFLLIVLALQILNISVQARPMGEDLLIDQYSIANPADHAIEYIVETVFHKKDAFPEQPNHHHRHPLQMHKTISFKLFSYYPQIPQPVLHFSDVSFRWPVSDKNSCQFTSEINPPPPKS